MRGRWFEVSIPGNGATIISIHRRDRYGRAIAVAEVHQAVQAHGHFLAMSERHPIETACSEVLVGNAFSDWQLGQQLFALHPSAVDEGHIQRVLYREVALPEELPLAQYKFFRNGPEQVLRKSRHGVRPYLHRPDKIMIKWAEYRDALHFFVKGTVPEAPT